MEDEMESWITKNPPNTARVMDGLRDTGYDFNTAVADIIDNSIAANATMVIVKLQMDPLLNVSVSIADDGIGMDEDGLINAMRYGSAARSNPNSLGKFGLGLKTASTAFCKKLSVISRNSSDGETRKVTWDLDYIAKSNDWDLLHSYPTQDELDLLEEAASGSSGTLVLWNDMDRLFQHEYSRASSAKSALNRLIDNLRFHISLVYQRFLDNQDARARNVAITVNGQAVEAWDPFCVNEPNTELLAENLNIEIEKEDKPESQAFLSLRAFLLPRKEEFSTAEAGRNARVGNDLQGIYVYRENRLIHYGDWMDMFSKEPHGSLLRVELSFDHNLDEDFNVDIKKSRILLNDDIYNYIRDQFLPAPRREADLRYRHGTSKKVASSGNEAHDAANRTIDEKASGIEESRTTVIDPATNDVEVENKNGIFRSKITIHSTTEPGRCRVIPVETLDADMLWEPSITQNKHSVLINKSHPYYQKIYYPILDRDNVVVTGMDVLLWALSEAEFSTFNDETRDQYEDMRVQVSRMLKKLVDGLPEPLFSDGEDEENER